MRKDFYVYAYLRGKASRYGEAGTPYYIGKGKSDRAFQSKGKSAYPPVDVDRIKIISDKMTEPDAFQLEMFLIYVYGRIDKGTGCLRNKTDGGEGPTGAVRSPAFRQKLRLAHLNTTASDETRQKMSTWQKGRKLPLETREKIAASNRRRVYSLETRQKLSIATTRYFSKKRHHPTQSSLDF